MSNILRASKFASSAPRSPATPTSQLYIGSSSPQLPEGKLQSALHISKQPLPPSLPLMLLPLLLAVFWCCVRCICAKQVRNIHIVTYNRAAGRLLSPPTATYPSKKNECQNQGKGQHLDEIFFGDG